LIGVGFEHPRILEGLFQAIGEEAHFRNNWIIGFEKCKVRAIAPVVIVSVFEKQKVPQLKQLAAQATGKWPLAVHRLANRIDKPRAAPPTEQHSGVAEGFIVILEIRPKRVFASLAFDELWVGNDLTVVHGAA
jgi:hypothetical protein